MPTHVERRTACRPFAESLAALKQHNRQHKAPRAAVCLTGQLRLFMVGFPTLVRNLLLRSRYRLDIFYVGPADSSYLHGRTYLHQIPGLRAWSTYSPKIRWHEGMAPTPLAELLHESDSSRTRRGHGGNRSYASINLRGLRSCGIPIGRLQSRLVQALQAKECLRLIEKAEAGSANLSLPSSRSHRYAGILRLRADLLALQRLNLPPVPTGGLISNWSSGSRTGGGSRRQGKNVAAAASGEKTAGAPVLRTPHQFFTAFAACERGGKSERTPLAAHDYALYGERSVMSLVMGAIEGLTPAALVRSGCDVSAVAAARLRLEMPQARCTVARHNGTSPLASVRGAAIGAARSGTAGDVQSGGCFFLDQEHPPNDGEAQPRLTGLFPHSADVATECLQLSEQRDGRRPGAGPVCLPHGGWDGDFREMDSPWDSGSAPNRGAG